MNVGIERVGGGGFVAVSGEDDDDEENRGLKVDLEIDAKRGASAKDLVPFSKSGPDRGTNESAGGSNVLPTSVPSSNGVVLKLELVGNVSGLENILCFAADFGGG